MLNTFRFRFFSKKQKYLWRGLLVLVLNFSLSVPGFDLKTYAAKSIVLSDAELDSVYAEGFSFDIDVAFGNINDYLTNSQITSTVKPVEPQNTIQPGLAQTNNPGVNSQPQNLNTNIISPVPGLNLTSSVNIPTIPTTVSSVSNVVPVTPTVVPNASQLVQGEVNKVAVGSNNSVSSQPQIVSIPKIDIPVQGLNPTATVNIPSTSAVANPASNVVPSTPVIPTVVPNVSPLVQGEVNKGAVGSNSSVSGQTQVQPQIVSIPKVDIPVRELNPIEAVNIPTTLATASSVNNTVPAKTSVPVIPTVVQNIPNSADKNGLSPLQFDIVAGSNADGQLHVDVDSPTAFNPGEAIVSAVTNNVEIPNMPTQQFNPGVYSVSPNGTTGNNIVVVDALAQQNLSAFVNVNAAGSIVPVLLNITININSTVGNISNANNLDLQNYYRFQIR